MNRTALTRTTMSGLSVCLLAAATSLAARPEHPRITSEQGAAAARHTLEPAAGGYRLHHPRHQVTFGDDGVLFEPRRGGPRWHWRLAEIQPQAAWEATGAVVAPTLCGPETVCFVRDQIIEQYVPRAASVEQQFVIPRALPLAGQDLVIAGLVRCAGTLETTPGGWQWRTADGVTQLGGVHVYDAAGHTLAAWMTVSADRTRIVVDGAALSAAVYPVVIDPQIGVNDMRISRAGPDASTSFDAGWAAVAYNSAANEYLVVWQAEDDSGDLVDGEREIYGQRIDAASGSEIGEDDFRISDMGTDGNPDIQALMPAVAYNSTADEYLVVWVSGDDTLADGEIEVFGQRLAADGSELGTNDFRISDMGTTAAAEFDAQAPAVAYNATANEYLVVWDGVDSVAGKTEIFGQRISATGQEVGTNDFLIGSLGPEDDPSFDAVTPAVVHNSVDNEYLVVWVGDDDTAPLVEDEFEVFGRRLSGSGAAAGPDSFRISDMGLSGSITATAANPAVAYNPVNNEYLVVWDGDDGIAPLADDEREVYSQRLDAAGTEVGNNDLRISDIGQDGDPDFDARDPTVAYNATDGEYLVVWDGDALVDDEREIFGQRLHAASGVQLGTNDFRISDMGSNDGNSSFDASLAAVAFNTADHQYAIVWTGDDDTPPQVDDEEEVFFQGFSTHTVTTIVTHTPDPSEPSAAVMVSFSVSSAVGTPTGNVTVSDGLDNCLGTAATGMCTLALRTAGARELTARYEGDDSFSGSESAGVSHTVSAAGGGGGGNGGNNPGTGGCGAGAGLLLPLSLSLVSLGWMRRRRRPG